MLFCPVKKGIIRENNRRKIMVNYHEILGKPVFFVDKGKKLGKVKEAVIDTENFRVAGFIIKEESEKYLGIKEIKTFGEEAVVAEKLESLADMPSISGHTPAGKVIGNQIVTKKGKLLGKVVSFYFREEGGNISYYQTSEGAFKELAEGRGLLSGESVDLIGPEAVIAKDEAGEIAGEMKTGGGLKKVFSKTAEKLKRAAARVKKQSSEKADEARDKIGSEVKKDGDKIRQAAAEAGEKAGQGIDSAKDKLTKEQEEKEPKQKEQGPEEEKNN